MKTIEDMRRSTALFVAQSAKLAAKFNSFFQQAVDFQSGREEATRQAKLSWADVRFSNLMPGKSFDIGFAQFKYTAYFKVVYNGNQTDPLEILGIIQTCWRRPINSLTPLALTSLRFNTHGLTDIAHPLHDGKANFDGEFEFILLSLLENSNHAFATELQTSHGID